MSNKEKKMKRKLLITAVIFALLFIGCTQTEIYEPPASEHIPASIGVSEPRELRASEVAFRIITEPMTTATDWLDYEIANYTNIEFTYGEELLLFRVTGSDWLPADFLPGVNFGNDWLYLPPYTTNYGSINIAELFGELSEGDYRLLKSVFSEDEMFIVSMEFTVGEKEK